jgi:hypothetical protein
MQKPGKGPSGGAKSGAKAPLSPSQAQQLKQFQQITQNLQRIDGLLTLYRDRSSNKLFAEIKAEQLNTNYLCTMTLESGIGEQGIYGGIPLADFLFRFQQVTNTLQFVVPNVYFRAQAEDPLRRAIAKSFSDSVLASLPIKGYHPNRKTYLVELGPTLLADFPGIAPALSSILGAPYSIDTSKTYIGSVQGFPLNVELETVYNFNFASNLSLDGVPSNITTLPDSRNFNLKVRYSLSQLPAQSRYRPRRADDRVGYFISAYQNLSDESPSGPFVRYINRWHLEKQDPSAPLSPPKQPIVFWLDNTIPREYREAVRDGVLMWNRAFEKIGFKEALQVQQMPDNPSWDPADIRYNTIRWISSFDGGFLGFGPFRANPLTGEILDADILIDANFVRYLKQQYRSIAERKQMRSLPALSKLLGDPNLCSYGSISHALQRQFKRPQGPVTFRPSPRGLGNYDLCYGMESSRQFAFGALSLTMLQGISPTSSEVKQYVQEFLRSLIAHEVGHTLGLRHNFRASAMLSPADLNNREITRRRGLVGSVMDYSAVNLAPAGTPQGDYFTSVIGPYDEWAIAFGYTPVAATESEAQTLAAIARRAPEPDLAYGTDEDAFARLDPRINPFDLSNDLLTYAPQQLAIARQMWQQLDQRYPRLGGSFNEVRVIFDEIFDYYFQYSVLLTQYIGGESFNRYRGGDAQGRFPFEPVSLSQQRQALALLIQYVFDSGQFRFSPGFLNKLAPSRWSHWGEETLLAPLDYPIHEQILFLQTVVLDELLDYQRLGRLRDAELKTNPGEMLTLPELFETLQTAIWKEPLSPQRPLRLSSLQRGLQHEYLKRLSKMVLQPGLVPDDARVLAWYNLKQLRGILEDGLKQHQRGLDTSTRAHLEEARDRVLKTLQAQLNAQ